VLQIANGTTIGEPPSAAERRAARQRWGLSPDEFVVGAVGRFVAEKGLHELAEAAQRTADQEIVWLAAGGDGLAPLVGRSPANLRAVGYVSPPDLLPALDIYVQASHREGLSMALLEAAGAVLPIVATRVGETDQVLRHEKEALLVNPRDASGLVEAVLRLRREPKLRRHLAAAARRRVATDYSTRAMAQAYRSLYLDLIAASSDVPNDSEGGDA
jgi:glycosyltransferase involved in cell wall biosynthesis